MIREVDLTNAKKDIKKVPLHIRIKLFDWVDDVEGRKVPEWHDDPLKRKRQGQRSIRLSLSYRAIYVEKKKAKVEFVSVEEVNKHEY